MLYNLDTEKASLSKLWKIEWIQVCVFVVCLHSTTYIWWVVEVILASMLGCMWFVYRVITKEIDSFNIS
jgi:hypothetical protein